MSKDYCGFENEDSQTAFLAGVVDILSDNLSMVCNFTDTLDADIFYVKEKDISELNSVVKNFEEWYSDEAEIKEYEKDKSFTVFVPGLKSEDPENVLYGTIKFVKEDGEWKIDSFDYNNIVNTRFKE